MTTPTPDDIPTFGAVAASFAAKSTPQPQALGAKPIFEVVPASAGHAKFQAFSNSHPNFSAPGVPDGTYNFSVHMGMNAGVFTGLDSTPGVPALGIGFEDAYYDPYGDLTKGMEFYLFYSTPDHTTIPVDGGRPLYFRVLDSHTNTATKKYLWNIDLGGGGGSIGIGHIATGLQHWAIQEDAGGGVPLITHFAQTWFKKNIEVQPTSGTASINLHAPGTTGADRYSQVLFSAGTGGAYAGRFAITGGPTTFTIDDIANAVNLVMFTPGANVAARQMEVNGAIKGDGKFGVNGATPQARATVAALPATISATYTQSEVTALKTSVQNMLVALYQVGIVA